MTPKAIPHYKRRFVSNHAKVRWTLTAPIESLLRLQEKDRRLARVTREIRDIPKRREQVRDLLNASLAEVEAARSEIQRVQAEAKELELEAASAREKIGKYRLQQNQVKTNQEYRALEDEIRAQEREVRRVDDKQIELLEKVERVRGQLQEKQAKLREEESALKVDEDALEARVAHLEEEKTRLASEREALVGEVEPTWLSRYERLRARRGDHTIALVERSRGTCGACHMKLPPQLVHDSRNPETVTVCTFCGSMLYCRD